MDPRIADYIRANKDRYTRAAITEQLVTAGYDAAAIQAAWAALDTPPHEKGWRPGWVAYLLLLVLGTIGAALVWADEPYGGGGFAAVAYAIIVSIAFAIGKGLGWVVDRIGSAAAGVFLAVVAVGGGVLAYSAMSPLLALFVAPVAGIPAILLLVGRGATRTKGVVAAAIPLVAWVVVTGTCYAPVIGQLSAR